MYWEPQQERLRDAIEEILRTPPYCIATDDNTTIMPILLPRLQMDPNNKSHVTVVSTVLKMMEDDGRITRRFYGIYVIRIAPSQL